MTVEFNLLERAQARGSGGSPTTSFTLLGAVTKSRSKTKVCLLDRRCVEALRADPTGRGRGLIEEAVGQPEATYVVAPSNV